MRRHCLRSFVLAFLAFPSLLARADEPTQDEDLVPRPLEAARSADMTEYAFEDDQVLGDGMQPGLEVLHAGRRAPRKSLVRARTQFVRELLKSVEQL